MIADSQGLERLLEHLAPFPQIAIDTEADSLHSYFEKLCLVQISTPEGDFLVDPLAGFSLQPLYDALAPKRLVFHGADYDLRLLHRSGNFAAADLFDTMIASRLCGSKELGLAALVDKHFGVKLSKASQKANWGLRPLSKQMLDYAVCDTKYLLPLAALIEADLHRLGRWEWFVESRDRMIVSAREPRERDESTAWRITGSAALNPRAQSALRVLWHWRDSEARSWDRPPFHVMGNDDLLRIAEKSVRGESCPTPRMNGRRRKSFEVVLALAQQIPEAEWPTQPKIHRKRPTREETACVNRLKALRDKVAASLDLDPAIVAPRSALEAAALDPATPALMNWQKALLDLPAATLRPDAA